MKTRIAFLASLTTTVLLSVTAAQQKSVSAEAHLRAAMDAETVDGDLKTAADIYMKLGDAPDTRKETRETARLRLGALYEKQRNPAARTVYDAIVQDRSSSAVALRAAEARLAAMASSRVVGTTITRVCEGADCDGSVSRDGRYLLTGSANARISVRDLRTGKVRQLEAPERARWPSLSPDGKHIYYTTGDPQVAGVMSAKGGPGQVLFPNGYPAVWSPDSRRVLVVTNNRSEKSPSQGLMWVSLSDRGAHRLPVQVLAFLIVKLSPEGKYIAFSAYDEKYGDGVYVMASDGSGQTLVFDSDNASPVGWTPDGKYLLVEQGLTGPVTLWALPMAGGIAGGTPVVVHRFTGEEGLFFGDVTDSGVLYYRTSPTNVQIYMAALDPATGRVTATPRPVSLPRTGRNLRPRFSPDGRRLAYVWNEGRVGDANAARELRVYSFDERREVVFPTQGHIGQGPVCWSADGDSIVISRRRTQRGANIAEAMRVNLTTRDESLLFPANPTFWQFGCSKTHVVGHVGDSAGLIVRGLSDGSDRPLYRSSAGAAIFGWPAFSRSGELVAFGERLDSGVVVLRVAPTNGGAARELTRGAGISRYFAWSADDQFVYFSQAAADGTSEVLRVPVTGGPPVKTGFRGPGDGEFDLSSDEKTIVGVWGQVREAQLFAMRGFLPQTR